VSGFSIGLMVLFLLTQILNLIYKRVKCVKKNIEKCDKRLKLKKAAPSVGVKVYKIEETN